MTRVAIVGAGGFVGSKLIESFVLSGHKGVRAVVRRYRNIAGFCQFAAAVDTHLADAEDPAALVRAFRDVDTVVNVTTGPPAGIARSTGAIHDACVRGGVRRFVHLSSAVVYGDVPEPVTDDSAPVKRHWMPYARAKAASEAWVRERLDTGPLDVVVLRPGIVWGVGSPHTIDLARRLAGKRAFLVDGGRGIFNGIYIDNLVAAIRTACEPGQGRRGFYNVGDREAVTWREFFGALGPALGCDPARLRQVDGNRFPWSVGSAIDAVQSLPFVNELYHRLKSYAPDAAKAAVRSLLDGAYCYERCPAEYDAGAGVDRELWHLQRVRHKLPVDKFASTFGFAAPVPFQTAVRRTLAWLASIGLVSSRHTRQLQPQAHSWR